MDGAAAASGVAQGAVGAEDSSSAKAWSGDGSQAHAAAAQPAAAAGLVPAPYGHAVAGAVGVGADVHSADGAGSGNPLMNASHSHAEAGSGLEQVHGKSAGTAVPPIPHANQFGDHSPSQMNPPQSQATAEARIPDGNHQHARMEERERRISEYHAKLKGLKDEYEKNVKQLQQEYSDVAQEPSTAPQPS